MPFSVTLMSDGSGADCVILKSQETMPPTMASNAAFIRSCVYWPGMPISVDRSLAPICSTSMPSTAAIAPEFSTASGVSIIAINRVCSLRTLQTSACGMAA